MKHMASRSFGGSEITQKFRVTTTNNQG